MSTIPICKMLSSCPVLNKVLAAFIAIVYSIPSTLYLFAQGIRKGVSLIDDSVECFSNNSKKA